MENPEVCVILTDIQSKPFLDEKEILKKPVDESMNDRESVGTCSEKKDENGIHYEQDGNYGSDVGSVVAVEEGSSRRKQPNQNTDDDTGQPRIHIIAWHGTAAQIWVEFSIECRNWQPCR